MSPYPHILINYIASGVVFAPWGWYRFSCQAAGGLASVGGPLMTFSPDCWEKISQRGAGSFAPSTGPGTPFFPREVSLMSNASSAKGNPQSSPLKCRGFKCDNDAIGSVTRDPYDHVSGSPLLIPGNYCLNCYNVRILAALEFIRREK